MSDRDELLAPDFDPNELARHLADLIERNDLEPTIFHFVEEFRNPEEEERLARIENPPNVPGRRWIPPPPPPARGWGFYRSTVHIGHGVSLVIITFMGLPGTMCDVTRHIFNISVITLVVRLSTDSVRDSFFDLTPRDAFVAGFAAGGPILLASLCINVFQYVGVAAFVSLCSIAIKQIQGFRTSEIALWSSLLYLNWKTPKIFALGTALIALTKFFENRLVRLLCLIFEPGELSLTMFLFVLIATKNCYNINAKFITYLCLVVSNILLIRKMVVYIKQYGTHPRGLPQFDFAMTRYILATVFFSVFFYKNVPTLKFLAPTAGALIVANRCSGLVGEISRAQWLLIGLTLLCFPEKVLGLDVSASCADIRFDYIPATVNLIKTGVREAVGLFKHVFRF